MTKHAPLGPLVETKTDGRQKTILFLLRNAARLCSNPEYRATLIAAAERIAFAIDDLAKDPTTARMQALNGAWADGVRIYEGRPPEADPNPPLAGAPAAALLREVA